MKTRMYQLFYTDERARATMYACSWVMAFLFGVTSMALGSEVREAAIASAIMTIVILSVWTLAYCWSPAKIRHERLKGAHWELPTRRLALTASVLITSVLAGLSTVKVEAAVINKKLKKYANRPSLDALEVRALMTTLNYARVNALKLNPVLLGKVGLKLTNTPAPEFHKAAQFVAVMQSEMITPVDNPRMPRSQSRLGGLGHFRNLSFEGMVWTLDANSFENCIFIKCLIQYAGGAAILHETEFAMCQFEISNSAPGRELLAQLVKGGTVDFSYNA